MAHLYNRCATILLKGKIMGENNKRFIELLTIDKVNQEFEQLKSKKQRCLTVEYMQKGQMEFDIKCLIRKAASKLFTV